MINQPSNDDFKHSLALINELNLKMRRLVEDFAKGVINRAQFQSLYERYQNQLSAVMQMSSESGMDSPISGGGEETIMIKKRLMARVLGLSIYSNQSGMPIETLGEFSIDTALLVPMLSSYRAATREIFKAGMRSTMMENGQWLWFVPGQYTTLIALFSVEASTLQLNMLARTHRDFETANQASLSQGHIDPSMLAYPYMAFVHKAHQSGHAKPQKS